MHFWCPGINDAVREKVKTCLPCQVHTNKTTKEPQAMLESPENAWDKVALDLFGPMSNGRHILVAQDMPSRFPAAKTVCSTSAQEELPSLDDIYTSYGYPNTHLTDNGPPFNSVGFKNYSLQKGIQHQRTYPYHPQANPAERIMKPIGKAMKAAFMEGANQQQALNQFLATYRGTPHIATGVPPGDFLLRDAQ